MYRFCVYIDIFMLKCYIFVLSLIIIVFILFYLIMYNLISINKKLNFTYIAI